MLERLRELLGDAERIVARAVFELAASELDIERSSIEESPDFLRCRFVAVADRHCPFELDFGRGEHHGRFNFIIGRGAQFATYELLSTPDDARELQLDVENFLGSTVEVESHSKNGEVLKERYVASRLAIDGTPLSFWYKGGRLGLFSRATVQRFEYSPWLAAPKR